MVVVIRTIIEVAGFPQEHVDETLKNVLGNLKKEEGIKIVKEQISPAEKIKEMFSTFASLELSFTDVKRLYHFCFFYLPSSIELVDSEEVKLSAAEFTSTMNDLLATLHQYNMVVSNLHAENEVLKEKMQPAKKE